MMKNLSDESGEKILLLVSSYLFSYSQKTFKSVNVSLIFFISTSLIHGAQDASHSPSTHSSSLRDTARYSACTCFYHTCQFEELVIVTYVTIP